MKKYNWFLCIFFLCYLILAMGIGILWEKDTKKKEYRVEINRILASGVSEKTVKELNKRKYDFVTEIFFLPKEELREQKIEEFYREENKLSFVIHPVLEKDNLIGYARFHYKEKNNDLKNLIVIECMLFFTFSLLFIFLYYIKQSLMMPFFQLTNMPYELAKGHLQTENYETKNKYFGRFLWGIGMLRDTLKDSKNKTLRLEKEKKLLLLSLSHDIKTPLNTIKLYVKALEEHLYSKKEEETIIEQIGEKALEIEEFVRQMVKSSTEDILHIEVEQGEYYLKDLLHKVSLVYETKCQLLMTEFHMDDYENQLCTGDMERMEEVLENLLENALKYGDGKEIHISFYEEDYRVLIRVFNTGTPVTEQEFIHLYDSFFRGNNTKGKEGNGLGLYICKQIMTKMNGDIFTEREENGMAFIIVMP